MVLSSQDHPLLKQYLNDCIVKIINNNACDGHSDSRDSISEEKVNLEQEESNLTAPLVLLWDSKEEFKEKTYATGHSKKRINSDKSKHLDQIQKIAGQLNNHNHISKVSIQNFNHALCQNY